MKFCSRILRIKQIHTDFFGLKNSFNLCAIFYGLINTKQFFNNENTNSIIGWVDNYCFSVEI